MGEKNKTKIRCSPTIRVGCDEDDYDNDGDDDVIDVPERAKYTHAHTHLRALYQYYIIKTGSGIPSVLRLPSLVAFTFQMI